MPDIPATCWPTNSAPTGSRSICPSDALRYGIALMDRWGLSRAPVRMAGDALHLPFRDGSLRLVMTFQTLSQFQDIEAVFGR